MLDTDAVAELAKPILERAIAPSRISEVRVEEMADSDGEDALDVTAIAEAVTRDTVSARVDASVEVQRALHLAGDTRYAFIRYTTEAALSEIEEDDELDA